MCVRYTLHRTDAALEAVSRALGEPLAAPDWVEPRYNVTLTDMMPVVARINGATELRAMRWGIIPHGDRALPRPRLLANARSETAQATPAFRKAAGSRRCLVPANGFFEWKDSGGIKRPHLFTLRGDEPFAFAGLWEREDGDLPMTYCILTTAPNELVARVHDRMPVILTGRAMRRWLGDMPLPPEEFGALAGPFDPGLMECREVSRYVSSNRNQGPRCLEPPEEKPGEPEFDFG